MGKNLCQCECIESENPIENKNANNQFGNVDKIQNIDIKEQERMINSLFTDNRINKFNKNDGYMDVYGTCKIYLKGIILIFKIKCYIFLIYYQDKFSVKIYLFIPSKDISINY
jgi:hypothetical protein